MTATSDDDVALLGLLGAGSLCSFEALAHLSSLAPEPGVALGVAERCQSLLGHARGAADLLGERVDTAMSMVHSALVSFAEHTRPRTWAEGVLRLYLMLGAAHDLIEATAVQWPQATRQWWRDREPGRGLAEEMESVLIGLLDEEDQRSRLGLFGRRVIGEATAQAQRVAAARPALAAALTSAEEGSLEELSRTTQLVADLVEASAQRMLGLGLQP